MERFYRPETEKLMCQYYSQLSEKDRRHYAAIEAQKLMRGGLSYISNLFGLHPKTIRRGLRELAADNFSLPPGKQRKSGGGRKKILPTNYSNL